MRRNSIYLCLASRQILRCLMEACSGTQPRRVVVCACLQSFAVVAGPPSAILVSKSSSPMPRAPCRASDLTPPIMRSFLHAERALFPTMHHAFAYRKLRRLVDTSQTQRRRLCPQRTRGRMTRSTLHPKSSLWIPITSVLRFFGGRNPFGSRQTLALGDIVRHGGSDPASCCTGSCPCHTRVLSLRTVLPSCQRLSGDPRRCPLSRTLAGDPCRLSPAEETWIYLTLSACDIPPTLWRPKHQSS